ncbi:long-chain fatty acid--CoA ligase [Algivirga pacifica]|uniref:Long-chain fatty acid--CoA ligase n=1 Tax=Algivirga pacifica TaxID=1162670 RepID=A0ABP9DG31_9BACT
MHYTKDWFSKWAMYEPDKVAIREADSGREITYGELNKRSDLVAFAFQQLGLQKGDRVAILSEFCLEYVLLLGVAQRLGIILVPLNYRLSGRELDYILYNSSPKMVITDLAYRHLLNGQDYYEAIQHRLSIQDIFKLEEYAEKEVRLLKREELEENDPLFILYTSGTTGFPKGALYTHGMMFWNSVNTEITLTVTSNDHTIVCMPPFHTGGWNVLLTPLLMHGACITLMPKFDADKVLKELEEQKITLFMAVPTMLKMMADSPLFEEVDLSPLRYFIVGGEAMPIPLIEQWANKGVMVRQGFGLTEAGPNITSLHHRDAIRKKGSIGLPNFYIETRLVDDKGEDVKEGEVGEFLIKGPIVTPGYWKNPEATAQAFYGEWFRTGDLLKQDREGYLYVMDRIKHMYISGGENVYPAEVEHALREQEGIKEIAIVGVPDEKWGETGFALIVGEGETVLTEDIVLQKCQGILARYKQPRHFYFVNELPKGDTGKINRKEVKKIALEQLAQQTANV